MKLFTRFPREVGLYRKIVKSYRAFRDYIIKNNGVNDCYTSLYDINFTIDKVFFDFDGKGALETAKTLYEHLYTKGYPVIPVITGKKGFHIYLLVKPDGYTKRDLTIASYSILYSVFGEELPPSVDTHVLGDIRRLVRIPNTLRPPENLTWCSYLPPDFHELRESEIYSYQKAPHDFEYPLRPLPSLSEFINKEIKLPPYDDVQEQNNFSCGKADSLILECLRPCLAKLITLRNPPHYARVAVTVDLLNAGFTDKQILEFFKTLNWIDFKEPVTLRYIKALRRHKYRPYSCKKLKILGACLKGGEKCYS